MHELEAARRGRVLVVEDSIAIRSLLETLLERRGYDVVAVGSGQAAIEAAVDGFDLVLLDIGLPDVNGLEVCRRLRSATATAELPIIMLTGHDDPRDIRDAFTAGADDVLTKPFDESELVARLFSASLTSLRP
jgi:two-component system, OmpR family, response regulator